MNRQQLAAKIWESANKLRSKIEANEYKDYILGFIFYKFLSDKEEQFLRKDGWEADDLKELTENDTDTVDYCRHQLGYYISYKNLFSTWLAINDFGLYDKLLANVNRSIAKEYIEKVEGRSVKLFRVPSRVDKLLRQFILSGGFDVE